MLVCRLGANILLPPPAAVPKRPFFNVPPAVKRLGYWYANVSTRSPHLTAAMTGVSILSAADIMSQALERTYARNVRKNSAFTLFDLSEKPYDLRRTLALGAFGFFYYGGPIKFLYLRYDKMFKSPVFKVMVDCFLHTPFIMIPSFYFCTGLIQGKSVGATWKLLKEQWAEVSLGSLLFWTPSMALNFYFVPQHTRVFAVACQSFFHKTWFSWVSNRHQLDVYTPLAEIGQFIDEEEEEFYTQDELDLGIFFLRHKLFGVKLTLPYHQSLNLFQGFRISFYSGSEDLECSDSSGDSYEPGPEEAWSDSEAEVERLSSYQGNHGRRLQGRMSPSRSHGSFLTTSANSPMHNR